MKFGSKKTFTNSDHSGASGGITAANYVERAVAYIEAHGGAGFVIRTSEGSHGSARTKQPNHEAAWHAWMQYFRTKGIFKKQNEDIYAAAAQARGETTVPCEWPEDFDYEAQTSDKDYWPPYMHHASRDYSPIVSEKLKDLARTNGPNDPLMPRRKSHDELRLEALRALDEGFPKFAAKLVPSERLAKTLRPAATEDFA